MRNAAIPFSALMLAACGGSVSAPAAPDGVSEVVKQVFEICAAALNEGDAMAALPVAGRFGWELENTDEPVTPVDILRITAMSNPDLEIMLSMYEHDGPHQKYIGCNYSDYGDEHEALNTAAFDGMPGFEGRWDTFETAKIGHWSKKAGKSVLSVQVIQNDEQYSSFSMNKATIK